MCVLNYDEEFRFYAEDWRQRSRKARQCDACCGPIKLGSRYKRVVYRFDGDFHAENMCEPCAVDAEEFAKAHHGDFTNPANFRYVLFDCIDGVIEAHKTDQDRRWEVMLAAMDARAKDAHP